MAQVKVELGSFTVLAKQMKMRADQLRKKISFAISDRWQEHVMDTARLSDRAKRRYIMNIESYKEPKVGAYIEDFVTTLLEIGWKKFDMKPGLLLGIRGLPFFGLPSRVIPIRDKTGKLIFRTVSEKSKGWIHPGFGGAHVVQRVKREVPDIIKEIVARASK